MSKKQQPTVAPTAAPHKPAVYTFGKPYKVRSGTAQGNDLTWAAIAAAVQQGPKTRAELEILATARNHKPFVGYAIRRGWLNPQAE